jgi:hypothetical protein
MLIQKNDSDSFEDKILKLYNLIKKSNNSNINQLKLDKLIELYKLFNFSILFNGFSEFEI